MTKACFIIDPLDSLAVKKDSTLALIWEAQRRGWPVLIAEQNELLYKNHKVYVRSRPIKLLDITGDIKIWYESGDPMTQPLANMDVVLMRKDPPFNMDYIYATFLLEQAEKEGVLVVNKPQSLRDCNEKFFAVNFQDFTPPLIVTASKEELTGFHNRYKDVIIKPLDGMGGEGVFRVQEGDKNRNTIIETLTLKGKRQVMAQSFLPEIAEGDKRILLVDGKPINFALARMLAAGENRANLAAGGTGVACELTDRDRFIAEHIGPTMRQLGLLFVGLDVIGDCLTEINVTCPTGIRELDRQKDLNIAGELFDVIQNRLSVTG